ncbi:MAG: DUF1284 domain-containing protein [Pseudomonadota bacterium]
MIDLSEETAPDTQVLRFRPHHVLCALGYAGEGYSDKFTANMTEIVTNGLKAPGGDGMMLEIINSADRICAPCPHRRGSACVKQSRSTALDRAHAARLGLAAGQRLTWGEAKAKVRDQVRPGDLAVLCEGCQWLALGLCETALSDLHAETEKAAP